MRGRSALASGRWLRQASSVHSRIFLVVPLAACSFAACTPRNPQASEVSAPLAEAGESQKKDPIVILEELETLIAQGRDSEEDRVYAYNRVKELPDDRSASYAYARAALAGRVAELRGVEAGGLVTEAESFARKALERDPAFRDGAAQRMLGTLYVMAPPRLVEHGDSEEGLTILEDLAQERPEDPINHLRVAEAYVHLGDPEPAMPHLCRVVPARDTLRPDEQDLLAALLDETGPLECGAQ